MRKASPWKSDRCEVVSAAYRKHIQKHASEYIERFAPLLVDNLLVKVAQAWYNQPTPPPAPQAPAPGMAPQGMAPVSAIPGMPPDTGAGMGQAPLPGNPGMGQEMGLGGDNENLKSEIFGTQMANPMGGDVQNAIQNALMQEKDIAMQLGKAIYNIDLSEEDAMKIVKDNIGSLAEHIAKVPLEPLNKKIEDFTKAKDGNPSKSPMDQAGVPPVPGMNPGAPAPEAPAPEPPVPGNPGAGAPMALSGGPPMEEGMPPRMAAIQAQAQFKDPAPSTVVDRFQYGPYKVSITRYFNTGKMLVGATEPEGFGWYDGDLEEVGGQWVGTGLMTAKQTQPFPTMREAAKALIEQEIAAHGSRRSTDGPPDHRITWQKDPVSGQWHNPSEEEEGIPPRMAATRETKRTPPWELAPRTVKLSLDMGQPLLTDDYAPNDPQQPDPNSKKNLLDVEDPYNIGQA